jgi:catechol 2,3-dioxygenase-like lactoylglutathione lyase family enzyme
MSHRISGIHHVTAITSDPQQNIDFYCACSVCAWSN